MKSYLEQTGGNWNYILPTELNEDLRRGADYFLLDVRRPEDFRRFHIPGAVNVFWLEALREENLARIPRDRRIVLICYAGHTASQLMVVFKTLGYDVVALKYGMGYSPTPGVPVAGWIDYRFEIAVKE